MIDLLATAFESGWAFARHDGRTYLVRPPYTTASRVVVSEPTVERAVHAYGFHAATGQFQDWASFIAFLRDQIVKAREKEGSLIPAEGEAGMRLLRHAPHAILVGYLDRVEKELIPSGEVRAARKILNAVLELDKVKMDQSLSARASRLRERCYAILEGEEQRREELANDLETLVQAFPKALARYGQGLINFVANVQHRGRILEMGA
jgi:hypothetical protein